MKMFAVVIVYKINMCTVKCIFGMEWIQIYGVKDEGNMYIKQYINL